VGGSDSAVGVRDRIASVHFRTLLLVYRGIERRHHFDSPESEFRELVRISAVVGAISAVVGALNPISAIELTYSQLEVGWRQMYPVVVVLAVGNSNGARNDEDR
jgi:hypothetical protein